MPKLKRIIGVAITAVALLFAVGSTPAAGATPAPTPSTVTASAPALSATAVPAAKRYSSCKKLNKRYHHGVGLPDKKNRIVNRRTGKIRYAVSYHKVSKSLYRANKRLDRDRDGIACER